MYDTMGTQIENAIIASVWNFYSWDAYGAQYHGNHALDGMDQNLLKCVRKLWGSPHEQYWKHHMEKMDNIQKQCISEARWSWHGI